MTSTPETKPVQSAPAGSREKLARLPVLDGVRGLAILMVLVHHFLWIDTAHVPQAIRAIGDSLFIGVDLFFVLSGFLITRILLLARHEPHYFRNFYIRRTLRIFPLYYTFLLGMFLLWLIGGRLLHWGFLQPLDSLTIFPWVALYGTNIFIALHGPLNPVINPIWSLAVEEHFYLVWPAVVRIVRPAALGTVCVLIIIGTLLLRAHYAPKVMWSTLSFLTIFRADALAGGALLAILYQSRFSLARLWWVACAMLGISGGMLGAIVGAYGKLDDRDTGLIWYLYTVLAVFFMGFLVTLLANPDSPAGRMVGCRFLRFFGKYSYAMYLFNLPIWIYLAKLLPGEGLGWLLLREALAILLTVGLAVLSWHLLESRCLKLKERFEPKGMGSEHPKVT